MLRRMMDTGCIERVAPRCGGSLLPRELVLARLDHSWSAQLLGPNPRTSRQLRDPRGFKVLPVASREIAPYGARTLL